MNDTNRKTIDRLKRRYSRMCSQGPKPGELKKSREFQKSRGMKGWEIFIVPESEGFS